MEYWAKKEGPKELWEEGEEENQEEEVGVGQEDTTLEKWTLLITLGEVMVEREGHVLGFVTYGDMNIIWKNLFHKTFKIANWEETPQRNQLQQDPVLACAILWG